MEIVPICYFCETKNDKNIICDPQITACFTGHRSYDGSGDEALCMAIRTLYAEGYRIFLSGMAVGFDLAAAEMVLSLRTELPDLQLVAVLPFKGMDSKFSELDKRRFASILAAADKTITLATDYSVMAYTLRNNFLVDNATATIAYFDGSKGGTAYTVRRAVKRLHRYINLWQNPQWQLFVR